MGGETELVSGEGERLRSSLKKGLLLWDREWPAVKASRRAPTTSQLTSHPAGKS
jgi:hypothetical protein